MTYLAYLIAGIFLPLFPLSMIFNVLYIRIRQPLLRGLVLLLWPQIGLAILVANNIDVPGWLMLWSLLTSILYALRTLALRELGIWTSFLGTSAWALLWILIENETSTFRVQIFALGISMPLLMMTQLCAGLERRFGAAYLGLYGGLAHSIPRFSGVLVVVVLAIIATPLFPAFFAMLTMIISNAAVAPAMAVGVGIVWLLWSWSGARLLQGLIVGPQNHAVIDLSQSYMWLNTTVLAGLVVMGMYCLRTLV